ncbi:MAG: IS21 family transposase [candidate division Zixibacteria bacterium]|nr:IS21 family transposase [candidate division Zixibacteria bacterium]
MRKIKEVLRLKYDCRLSNQAIASSCGVGRTTVREYLLRAEKADLSWPLPEEMTDSDLDRLLFPPPPSIAGSQRPPPHYKGIHRELKRKGVTLFLLWQEYKEVHPEGYQYSRFCDLYREWAGKLDLPMRQDHKAGEKLFVDYAGQTMPVVDRSTGEIREAQIFVAVSGASNYTYGEATWTQTLPDWIASHTRAFAFMGGVHELVVPDNLLSGVSKACRYEPDINPTYHEMARHYGTAVMPARVRRPKDKAKVEAGVLGVERYILARLRNHTFFSLVELNRAIAALLTEYNEQPFQKLPGSRRSLFETLDKPALRPLPSERYEYAEWKKATVNIDYHVEVGRHYYSVPYQLVKQKLDVRVTNRTVECFHNGKRVASHLRSDSPIKVEDKLAGRHTTITEHMPRAHREYAEWTPERLVRWASKSGGATAEVVERILSSRPHPQQGFRSCLGIMRLGKQYGQDRLEAACGRALAINATSYKSIESILKRGLDRVPLPQRQLQLPVIEHANVRGAGYYDRSN